LQRSYSKLSFVIRIALFIALPALSGISSTFAAQKTDDSLERARALIESKLEFSQAITLLESAIARNEIAAERRAEAHYWLAIAHVARNEHADAVAAFEEVLRIEPTFVLDEMHSPKVRAAFVEAQRASESGSSAPPSDHKATGSTPPASDRTATGSTPPASDHTAKDSTPPASSPAPALRSDRPASSPAMASAPALDPLPGEPTPWYGHWWLWVGVAVAAAAAGTAVAVIATRDDDPLPAVTLP
jgi:tetratricopeptide (TPR) repeat protein